MRTSSLTFVSLLLAAALLSAGCAKEASDGALSVEGDSGFETNANLDETIGEPIAPDTGLTGGDAPTSDEVVQAALTDVDAYWARTFEDVYGEPYEPISGGFWPYGPDSEQPPCGEPAPVYNDIAENAFFCPTADLIAWDNVNLVPSLYDEFGGFTLGIVFAHEFGHAVQDRASVLGDTIMTELQADCFAGAWAADVEAGNSKYFELSLTDLDRAVAGFLELRDGVGTDSLDPAAHGTGFDRIGSFSEGYEQGAALCAQYPERYDRGELFITEVPFTDQQDFDNEGNLPLDEAVPLAIEDLEDFWATVFTEFGETWTPVTAVTQINPSTDTVECGGEAYSGAILDNVSFYCIDSDTVFIDGANLIPSLYDIGDYAVATELARQYAYAAQVRLGNTENSLVSNLQADCYAGVFASSGFLGNRGENQKLFLSPGDLDEAVIAFLQTSDAGDAVESGEGNVGTAFQRFDAYREGFMQGTTACDAFLEG